MAPSPDKTIVPKAPDKRDGITNSDNLSETIPKSSDISDAAILNQQEIQNKPPVLSKLDEGQLKALLEEAITYKRPKDRECKSTLFKELLQEAESTEAAPPLSRTRFQSERNETRNNNNSSHQLNKHSQRQLSHGGSLQDLADTCKFFDSNNTKIDSYSSRKNTGAKRKTVSVSARQSEGGSLPSNVNNSATFAYDRLFLYDDKFKKYGTKGSDFDHKDLCKLDISKRDFNDIFTTSCEINLNKTASSSNSSLLRFSPVPNNLIDPDVIEECQAALLDNVLSDDDQKQITCSSQEKNMNDERSDHRTKNSKLNYTSEFQITMENNNQNNIDSSRSSRSKNAVNDFGSTIQFSQFEKPLLLTSTYTPVQCLIGTGKSAATLTRPISWLTPASLPGLLPEESKKSLDENGNSLQAFNSTMASSQQQNALKIKREKPKQKKSDRNVKVIRSEEVVGHRNETNIDLLVQFIENDVNPKKMNGFSKMNKSNYKSDNISNNKQRYLEDKTKKKDRKNKDLQRNLFKSNSLEEVSCSVLEDLTNDNSSITMRGKPKKESNSSNDRRSWGEVSYIEETNFNGRNTNNQEVFEQMFDPSIGLPCELSNNYAELSEFHVVTKKKKTKKYHNHNIFSGDEKINLQRNGYYHNHKFQENNFTSNDLYMNHGAMAEQRRKSTSSMPPSDKSDSSDLDSVHSLPVESTSKKLSVRQISTSSGGTPLASYADITKMPNISNDPCNDICFNSDTQDKWSPQSKNMFPSLIESTATNDKSNHPKTMSLNNYNFPDLIESCHYYSEVQKKKENEECNKQDTTKFRSKLKLSQSKSVDMEDVYIQHKNVRNNEVTKPVSKAKDNQKYVKIKSNAEEHLKEPKSVNSKNNLKEKQNNTYSEPYLLLEHDSKKKNNINTINITSDLVSVCIQHDKLSEKKNVISGEHIDNKQQTLPPVIILDEDYSLDVHSDNDITFGFELNEKLLSGELSDTDSNNTIVYQETEINDHTIVHDNSKIENLSHETQNTLNSVGNILDEVVSKPVLKISSESNNKSYPTMEHAGHNDKSECDNNFKMKVQTNNSKCLNSIKFIPPTNAGGFENHDKIVSFIGIAWDEILKGGTAQYYTG